MDLEYWWRFGLAGCSAAFSDKVVLKRFKYANSLSGRNTVSVREHIKAWIRAHTTQESFTEKTHWIICTQPTAMPAEHDYACAMANDKPGMWAAFRQSLKYGFRPGSVRLLLEGLLAHKGADDHSHSAHLRPQLPAAVHWSGDPVALLLQSLAGTCGESFCPGHFCAKNPTRERSP